MEPKLGQTKHSQITKKSPSIEGFFFCKVKYNQYLCINKSDKTMTNSEILDKVQKYEGTSSFVVKMKEVIVRYGKLTKKQEEAVVNIFNKEKDEKVYNVNWPTVGQTIHLGINVGQKLKEKYELEFNPMLMDITRIIAIGKKEITFSGKMTIKRGDICMCCGRTLTDEFSMLSKLGKTCAKHMRINYIKNVNEVERFRDEYMKRVEEIGEMEFVVPKKQIKRWDGPMLFIVNQLHKR